MKSSPLLPSKGKRQLAFSERGSWRDQVAGAVILGGIRNLPHSLWNTSAAGAAILGALGSPDKLGCQHHHHQAPEWESGTLARPLFQLHQRQICMLVAERVKMTRQPHKSLKHPTMGESEMPPSTQAHVPSTLPDTRPPYPASLS